MADQQLKIRLDVIDNASKAFTEVKNTIFNLRNALIGIGVGASIKGILNVGSQAEKLRNQFLLLSPSIDEGKKSFEALQKFIASSPLESDSIERASEVVIAFSKNSNDLINNLTAIQNASIALGIDIETVSREFSSLSRTGIDGARELKRRNLEQFLGLQNGIKVSSEEIVRLFLKKFGKNGEFESATEAFANTFAGATNRFKNSFKNIQESIAQAGLLDFFADLTNVFTNFVRNNPELLAKIVKDFTLGLIEGIKAFASFTARLVSLIKEPFVLIVDSIKALDDLRKQFPPVVGEIGILGFLLLGTKGKIITIIIGDFLRRLNDLRSKGNDLSKQSEKSLDNQTESLIEEFDLEKLLLQQSQKRLEAQKRIEETIDKTKGKVEEQLSLFERIIQLVRSLNSDALQRSLEISRIIAEEINKGITSLAEGLAKSIILGEKLQNVFRSFLQNVLIKILSTVIETIARRSLEIILSQTGLEIERQKINYIQQQNSALLSQIGYQTALNGLRSSGGGGGGGGNSTLNTIGTIAQIASLFFAEGGSISAGQPAVVGERGRELFIPSTNGTIVPTPDLNGMGTIVNVNVSAVDVRGVEQLFINNRAILTNIINQALNAKGKSNLV